MLKIIVLNVGQGSSVIVHHNDGDSDHFGLIDSNHTGAGVAKGLEKLKVMGANRLSFVALTHPHRDHYRGMFDVISYYVGKIDSFYSCPFGDLISNRERFKKFAAHLLGLSKNAGSDTHRSAARELVQILRWASGEDVDWSECSGEENRIAPLGFSKVGVHTLTPAKSTKGQYIERIDSGSPWMFGSVDDNDISLSFRFEYMGHSILIGGDASYKSWEARKKFEVQSKRDIRSKAVNLPHHGSAYDSAPDVLERLISTTEESFGITSAGGISHPSIEAIDWMRSKGVSPYCTNLIVECGANVQQVFPMGVLNKEFARTLREASKATGIEQICQGDVTITVDASGMTVVPEVANYCPFRSGVDLFASV